MSVPVLVVVTHLLGAGHLTRALALARAFAAAGHPVTLVSGGMPGGVAPPGVRVVQLPPVRILGTAFGTLLDEAEAPVDGARLVARREALLGALAETRPGVVVTELYPFGRRVLAAEFDALLDAARALAPRPLVLASVRDILAPPSRPERAAATHRRLAARYDGVLVHGDANLVRLEESWPAAAVPVTLHYTGYVDETPSAPARGEGGGIVVSGGSSAAGLPLQEAALAAALEVPDRSWRILVGRATPEDRFRALAALAPPNATVERARPDFRTVLARADLSVSQAGYNTVLDLLAAGCRAVLVPFEAGNETEQRRRAEVLAERGLATVLPERDLTPEHLAGAVRRGLAAPLPPASRVARDGAARSVAIVASLLAPAGPAVMPARIDWTPLDDALARVRDGGGRSVFWWRDDDVVAPTSELERLLTLAGRHGWPLTLAAVPGRAEPSLADRLSAAPGVALAVHGLIHRNHAPAGEKKAEFGDHRPLSTLVGDARTALDLARTRLGPRLVPVLVPPWNRIAPALVARLPDLGYRALSVFGRQPVPDGRLAFVNTHVDPIAWRRPGRGLADPGGLVAAAAAAVSRAEPVGLLTHHGAQDEAVWAFCERFLAHLSTREALWAAPLPSLLTREGSVTEL